MIEINIARQFQAPVSKRSSQGLANGLLGGMVIVGIVLGCWWWAQTLQHHVDRLHHEKNVKTQNLANMREQLELLVKYEEKTKSLKASIERLKGAIEDKQRPIELLTMMSLSLHDKNLWLDQVQFHNHMVEIRGQSLMVDDVGKFMDALEEHHVVKGLPVVEIWDPQGQQSSTFSFLIRFTYAEKVLA